MNMSTEPWWATPTMLKLLSVSAFALAGIFVIISGKLLISAARGR